jgi:C4-dicarboxylate-specific signal transduction histidine kinase
MSAHEPITMPEKELQPANTPRQSAQANRVAALGKPSAAIVRELNQPLTTIALDAEAGLQWLARENPNVPEAIQSIRQVLRDVQRASRVAEQIRSLIANSSNQMADQSGQSATADRFTILSVES